MRESARVGPCHRRTYRDGGTRRRVAPRCRIAALMNHDRGWTLRARSRRCEDGYREKGDREDQTYSQHETSLGTRCREGPTLRGGLRRPRGGSRPTRSGGTVGVVRKLPRVGVVRKLRFGVLATDTRKRRLLTGYLSMVGAAVSDHAPSPRARLRSSWRRSRLCRRQPRVSNLRPRPPCGG